MRHGNSRSILSSPASTSEREVFLLEFAGHLHRHGIPAHRLERTLGQLADYLGLEGQFFSTPTSLFVGLGPVGAQHVAMLRLEPGEVDLGATAELDELARAMLAGYLPLSEARRSLASIGNGKERYPRAVRALAFGVASAAGARFFGGGGAEVAASMALGLLVAGVDFALGRTAALSRLFVLVAAVLVGAAAVSAQLPPVAADSAVVTLAGILVLLPGFTLTVAMTELATGHLASGTARVAGAAVVFVQLGFGVALGAQMAGVWAGNPPLGPSPGWPDWTQWVAVVLSPLSFAVLLRARRRDYLVIVAACALSFATARWGAQTLGPELGGFTGALASGVVANLYARFFDRPSSVPLVPATLMLVPGSVGFRGVMSLIHDDAIGGVDLAFGSALIAVGIVAGFLVANAIVPLRRAI